MINLKVNVKKKLEKEKGVVYCMTVSQTSSFEEDGHFKYTQS